MINIFAPSSVFSLLGKLIKILNSIIFITLIIGLTFALVISPPDYIQKDAVRIMYVHVPSAWLALASFSVMTFFFIINFLFKIKNLQLINYSIAPIGLLFTCLAIVTGATWGKPTWGTWWAWDARLTSMLILLIFYIIIILTLKYVKPIESSLKFATILSLIGAINIPIVKYSVDWWNTLHQPASIKISGTSTIDSSFLVPLFLMFLVFLIFSALIFLMKYKTEIIKIKKKRLNKYD
ncbi:MAG: heme transporter HemC [Candidatus Pelagibacter sp.]|nr:heme transporter HemC [Candidatus Pelagibacter sp.]OUW24344.1 MAG: heme transporter HemC [Rickettsiales bacterium TMED174]|tara:strand:+ start:1538 stop:2248 length:711 start_codon:yes stop_codon:yes gene_type:complete